MQCDSCGDEMVHEILAMEVMVAGRRASLDQPGWYCWQCKIGTYTASDLASSDEALAALLGKRRPSRAKQQAYRQTSRNSTNPTQPSR